MNSLTRSWVRDMARRSLASSSLSCNSQRSFSSFFRKEEYPKATEAPEITRTTAEDVKKQPSKLPDIDYMTRQKPDIDQETLQKIREQQRQSLNTKLSGSTPITAKVPSHIPPNSVITEQMSPETIITTLDNGIRVVSQETFGQVSTVGVVSSLGSRFEQPHEAGATHMLELLAFGETPRFSGAGIVEMLQDWGGSRFVTLQREQALHCVDLLRPNVPKAMDLLREVLREPLLLPEEVDFAKRSIEFMSEEMPPELLLSEALQTAAYGDDQQLGHPHYAPDHAKHLTPEILHNFWTRRFIENPKGIVIGGAGVQHDELVDLANQNFGDLKQGDDVQGIKPSTYHGGEAHIHHKSLDATDRFVRVALAAKVGGWHSDDLVAICVLQTLLGGGNSFSAGGPGKGMYSRLYRRILNRYSWAESAEAFSAFYEDTGLWGISGSTTPEHARDLVKVFAEHLSQLAVQPVSDEELTRARNMLKGNVLTQLESRLVLFEDLSRQVLTYGRREDIRETCKKIDAISAEDIQKVALKALIGPLTVVSVGEDLSKVPTVKEVEGWFGK